MLITDNFVFIMDSSREIVYFNEAAKKAYPKMQVGISCSEATDKSDHDCAHCPLFHKNSGNQSEFLETLGTWVSISKAVIEYPGVDGLCTVVTGSFYPNMSKDLMSRMRFMDKFTSVLEMDFTTNKYIFTTEETYGSKVSYSEETLSDLMNRTLTKMVHPEDRERFIEFFSHENMKKNLFSSDMPLIQSFRERNTHGTWDDVKVTLIPEDNVYDDHERVMALMQIKQNTVTLRHEDEVKLNSLTGLYTQDAFIKAAEAYAKQPHNGLCIIYFDIEHFRFFNKWYSRWQGDRLLRSISLFLHGMDRMFSTVSGYGGGDDFFIITENLDSILNYMVEGLNKLISSFDGIEGFRMAYGGYEFKKEDEEILDALDNAMTACKESGSLATSQICWFGEEMNDALEEEMKLLPDLDRAIEDREFEVFLQPKVSISDNKVIGAEALVRWKHKFRGYVSPGEFIPVLEKNGLITKVDTFVWEEVCKNLALWKSKGLTLPPVSVNVSRIDIFSRNVPEIIQNLVRKYDISPDLIEIEITESAFIDDKNLIRNVISAFRQKGFKVLIDDFGSGYSSLNMLKDVQADVLKMDIKFFDLNEDNFDKGLNIISSVVEMAHNIKMPVVAEGVETSAQIEILKNIGLNIVQGYFFYKPLPLDSFVELISDSSKVIS